MKDNLSSVKCAQCGLVNFATAESCKRCGNAITITNQQVLTQKPLNTEAKEASNRTDELKIVNLRCPNCGGSLDIHAGVERFACGYCGSEQIVERHGGTISLRLVDAVARVQVGTDKTAAELALVRLEKEIAMVHGEWQTAQARFFSTRNRSGPWHVISVFAMLLCIAGAIRILAAFAEGSLGSFLAASVFLAGAITGFVFAWKQKVKYEERYAADRLELWSPYAERLRDLDLQVAKNRILVSH